MIYVETVVRGDLATLWARTQEAGQHTRWDLRFTRITDLVAQTDDAPRGFRYELRLPGRVVAGTGTSIGERVRPDGTSTSALRFGSPDPLSLILEGRGWWRYVPQADGSVRFLTGYDYEPGWGPLGRVVDRVGFRRLLGWATAWSFDRLRLWVEDDVPPERALRLGLLDAGTRAGAAGGAVALVARTRRPLAVAAAATVLLAALAAPAVPGAPRARRCLRTPPDRTGRTPPGTLDRL